MKIFGIQVGAKTGVELAIEEAIVLIGEKRYDDAAAVIQDKALAREPGDRRSLLHLGICRMMQGRLDDAEKIFVPLIAQRHMDSEKAAAQIAMERVAVLRKEAGASPK